MKIQKFGLIALSLGVASSQSLGAGFALNSQSATGIGRAMAGDAIIADNASVMSRNPAAMAMFDTSAITGGLAYVQTEVEISDIRIPGETAEDNVYFGDFSDAADNVVVPNIFYIMPINNELAVGFGAFSNFGTGTDLSPVVEQADNIGQAFLFGNTQVTTGTINASASYRINDQWSIGAGLDIVYGLGELTRGETLGLSIEADGIGFGGILGVAFELNDNHRFGVSYRFSPTIEADGDIFGHLGEESILEFDGVEVPLPDIFQFAGFHQLTNQFALHYTVQWTSWSEFDALTATGCSSPNEAGLTCLLLTGSQSGGSYDIVYDWQDSWLYSLGGTYTVNDQWTLRAGYMYDKEAVDKVESISIPDSDRQWFTFGVGYNFNPKDTIDFGFAYIKGEENTATEYGSNGAISVQAETESGAFYYALQYSHSF